MNPAAVAVIRAAAIRNNLQAVRRAAPGCRVLAVIKANAYGHGLLSVARILADVDGFAVARLEEAVQLREAGIATRIVVLGGFVTADEARFASQQRLDMVVHSLAQVALLESLSNPVPMDLWVKADTGMGRLGIEPDSLGEVHRRLCHWLAGRGALRLMTHLAAAEEPANPATPSQLDEFADLVQGWRGDISIANSAGILQWPRSWSAALTPPAAENWIRPGLMLYGVSPLPGCPAAALGLRPAMSFETRLIAVKRVACGRRVGYGGDWQAHRDSLIGVAAAGYADGYPWHRARRYPGAGQWRARYGDRARVDGHDQH